MMVGLLLSTSLSTNIIIVHYHCSVVWKFCRSRDIAYGWLDNTKHIDKGIRRNCSLKSCYYYAVSLGFGLLLKFEFSIYKSHLIDNRYGECHITLQIGVSPNAVAKLINTYTYQQ